MKKPTEVRQKAIRRAQLLASCAETRRACNHLTEEQRRELLEQGLAMIYGHDAKATARSR
jgi:hypothetical protein